MNGKPTNVIDIAAKRILKTKETEVREAISEMDQFYRIYEMNIDDVEESVDDILLDFDINPTYNEESEIKTPFDSDVFLIREAIMSALMRHNGISHPLHQFTDTLVAPLINASTPNDEDVNPE